jgi:ketosteroid isomerase-like protein
MSNEQHLEVLRKVLDAFNRHDLDTIMTFFAADCVLETPRGSQPWGTRFAGGDEVRRGIAARFAGMPDVRYTDATHAACGDRGMSEWTIGGTTVDGDRVEVRGCDLWTFDADGRIVRKDSYWKIHDA